MVIFFRRIKENGGGSLAVTIDDRPSHSSVRYWWEIVVLDAHSPLASDSNNLNTSVTDSATEADDGRPQVRRGQLWLWNPSIALLSCQPAAACVRISRSPVWAAHCFKESARLGSIAASITGRRTGTPISQPGEFVPEESSNIASPKSLANSLGFAPPPISSPAELILACREPLRDRLLLLDPLWIIRKIAARGRQGEE
ncbi:hypothetical protein CSIM01_08456 [Colletotrichum simmondsii]|uniref:Uncharacterized protein n=1 Tax=Colletotrichum simmondsii TaxID=703756 RepID=A0A135SI39_9PEZI|nr:hypothetical protein CSIM01_08456 [Colletotrichum simmondsii]